MLRAWLSKLSSLSGNNVRQARRHSRKSHLSIENLEGRDLMAASLTASFGNGLLRVEGTEANDTIHIRQDAGQISVNGIAITTTSGNTSQIDARSVSRIEAYGLGGNDVVRLDQGTQPISVPALLDGGTGNDTLVGGAGSDVFKVGNFDADRVLKFAANDRVESSQPQAIQKVHVRHDGVIFSLNTSGVLHRDGAVVCGNTRDFALAADGMLYWLGRDGRLQKQSVGGAWLDISSTVSHFQLSGNHVVWLEGGSAGRLYEQPLNGSYRQISSTVSQFQVSGSYVMWLEGGSAGRLYEQPLGGSYRQISSTVSQFQVSGGYVMWLEGGSAGRLYEQRLGGSYRQVSSTVSQFQVSGGYVMWLEGGSAGRLYEQPLGGSYRQISSTVSQFQVSGGYVVWLEGGSAGRLYEQALGGNYRQISSTVSQFQVSGGYVVWLEGGSAGRLYEQPLGGNYRHVSSTVSRFQVSGGYVVWLEGGSAGRLYEQPLGGNYRHVSSTVSRFQVSGGYVVWLEGGSAGRLYEQPLGGNYRHVSSTVSQFQVSGGYVVWLEGGSAGRLYEQPVGGTWRQIASGVAAFAVNGAIGSLDIVYQTTLSADGTLTVTGTDGDDTIYVGQDDGRVWVSYNGVRQPGYIASAIQQIVVLGRGGNDVIRADQGAQGITAPVVLCGMEGNDYIVGGAGNDYLDGGAGDDTLVGLAGDDVLLAGASGNDWLDPLWGHGETLGNDTYIVPGGWLESAPGDFTLIHRENGQVVHVRDDNAGHDQPLYGIGQGPFGTGLRNDLCDEGVWDFLGSVGERIVRWEVGVAKTVGEAVVRVLGGRGKIFSQNPSHSQLSDDEETVTSQPIPISGEPHA